MPIDRKEDCCFMVDEIEELRCLIKNNKRDDAENVKLCYLGERLIDVMASYPISGYSPMLRKVFYDGLLDRLYDIRKELQSFGYGVKKITGARTFYPTPEVGNLYNSISLLTESEINTVMLLWLDMVKKY